MPLAGTRSVRDALFAFGSKVLNGNTCVKGHILAVVRGIYA